MVSTASRRSRPRSARFMVSHASRGSKSWSALTSSMMALMAVLKWKSLSMSSVTRSIVSWIDAPERRGPRRTGCPACRPARLRRHLAQLGEVPLDEPPDAVEEARRPFHAVVVPVEVLLGRRREEREEPRGVGPEAPDEVVGVHHVALRLRHLGAVLDDHPLREQGRERLVDLDEAEVAQHLGVEAGVEQVEDGVLDARRCTDPPASSTSAAAGSNIPPS